MPTVDDILAGVELEDDGLYAIMSYSRDSDDVTLIMTIYGATVHAAIDDLVRRRRHDRFLMMPVSRTVLVDWRRDDELSTRHQ